MGIVLVGASGFVGSAVMEVLLREGHPVAAIQAPRVDPSAVKPGVDLDLAAVADLEGELIGADVVVNCSGNPDASADDINRLIAANAVSPAIVARAAKRAGVRRLVHVSSAVVQGRRPQLDESHATEEFSPYAHSKAEGERRVWREFAGAIVYRPPSVHAEGRRVTSITARIASSPIASVASPGDQHSPQALIGNVASAIAYLATTSQQPPAVVVHPWEGLTSRDVMELLGGKRPILIPLWFATAVCRALESAGSRLPIVAQNARRIEMLWLGQDQADSWLTTAGWSPPLGRDAWRELGEAIRTRATPRHA